MLGAVPILACYTASMPVEYANNANRFRDTLTFLGITIALTVVRFLYCLLTAKSNIFFFSRDLCSVHAGVQVSCFVTHQFT